MFQCIEFLCLVACVVAVAASAVRCPARNKKQCPALVDAVVKGDVAAVRAMLRTCDVDSESDAYGNRTALHRAVSLGRPEMVFLLLDRGADLRRVAPDGLTPLHLAANSTHATDATETVAHLLLGGADRLARDDRGNLPLHLAARRGHLSAARLLLTACDPACRLSQLQSRDSGGTPEVYARRSGHAWAATWLQTATREAAEMKVAIAENGVELPLDKPYCFRLGAHVDLNTLKHLLWSCHADSVDPTYGSSALMFATSAANVDVTFTLLTYGSSVNQTNKDLQNSLHHAGWNSEALGARSEITGLLLLHKANRYQITVFGDNPLHKAVKSNNIPMVRLLLSNCDAACKIRQLRSVNAKLKNPSESASDAGMRSWLNRVHTEAAKERVQELKHGYRTRCGSYAKESDREKFDRISDVELKLDNINQTLYRYIKTMQELLKGTNNNNKSSTILPQTKI